MDGDGEVARIQHQTDAATYVDRLATRAGYSHESLQSAQTRVQLLRDLSTESFLEILTVGNSKLRGEYKRWQRDFHGEAPRAVVTSAIMDSPELEPPEHSEQEFMKLYQQMQGELTIDNLGLWATKLYTGVIFSHMFPDGNGRLSRNLFSWMTTGELAKDDLATKRGSLVLDFADFLNKKGIERILDRETGQRFDYRSIGGLGMARAYQADERLTVTYDSEQGLTARLKYIAAKRAGILDARVSQIPTGNAKDVAACYGDGSLVAIDDEDQYHQIQTTPWTAEEQARFQIEYQKARVDWFHEIQSIVDLNGSLFEYVLTLGMKVPNPIFLNIPSLTKILQAVRNQDQQQYYELMNSMRNGRAENMLQAHDTTSGDYYERLRRILEADEYLSQLVANPPDFTPKL